MKKNEIENIIIDYSQLMDLRVDFAFKTFVEGNTYALISLLNAIFANAKIKRIVKNVLLKNPNLDKKSIEDKLSILDVRAELDDGTDILIEMHLHVAPVRFLMYNWCESSMARSSQPAIT